MKLCQLPESGISLQIFSRVALFTRQYKMGKLMSCLDLQQDLNLGCSTSQPRSAIRKLKVNTLAHTNSFHQ